MIETRNEEDVLRENFENEEKHQILNRGIRRIH